MLNYIQSHARAQAAIHAAQNRHKWGREAARRYAERRGVSALYRLACQLEAATKQDRG